METIFNIIFVAVALYIIFKAFKHKSLKGAMFGSEIKETLGEVQGVAYGPIKTHIKVHSFIKKMNSPNLIGIEFVGKSFASYQMHPIKLNAIQTKRLIKLLQKSLD